MSALPPASLSDNENFLPSDYEDEEEAGDTQLFAINDDSSGDETDAEDYLPSQATENNTLSNDDDETDAEGDSDATDAELTLDDDELPEGPDIDSSDETAVQNDEPTQPVVEEPTIVIPDDSVILIDENEDPEAVQILPATRNRSPKKSPKKKSPVKAANLNGRLFPLRILS